MIVPTVLLENIKAPALKEPGSLIFLDEIDSTNSYLIQQSLSNKQFPKVVIARHQTHGRGRLERAWSDQTDTSFLFSVFYRFSKIQAVSLLPLVIGMAVAAVLRQYEPEIGLKWPNDLMFRDKKLGGILIESRFAQDWEVVIGIGINVYPSPALQSVTQSAIALASLAPADLNPSILMADLLDNVLESLASFSLENQAWPDRFQAYDLLKNHPIVVHTTQENYQGIALGIDAEGALLVQRESGELVRVLQATVRKI